MQNFYLADMHIAHANSIKFDGRPFASVQEMFNTLKSNWNARVTANDTVYILGDFVWGKEFDIAQYITQLNGKKVLICGNHDPKSFSKETRKLFIDIKDYHEIKDSGRHVIMSHYPMLCHKADYNPSCYMLYGHVHNTLEAELVRQFRDIIRRRRDGTRGEPLGQVIHIGCMEPYMNYTPRTLDEIIEGDRQYYPEP